MADLMDFLKSGAAGAAAKPFERPFDLTPEQSAKLMETMLPMIAAILQRQLSDPQAAANWVKFMSAMPNVKIAPNAAATKAAAKLFGSSEIADAVAEQVSATSGVGQAVAKAMLPWATAMMVGGLAAANAKPGSDLSEITSAMTPVLATIPNPIGPKSFADETIGEFVRGYLRGRPEPTPEPEKTEAEKMLQQMVDIGRTAHAAQLDAFDAMLDGWFGRK
jgi:hypothetical protein